MIDFRPTLLRSTAFVMVAALATPAWADINAAAVFEQLSTQVERQGLSIDAVSVSGQGDNVTLSGLTLIAVPGEEALELGDYVLENVSETEDGSYLVERIVIAPFEQSNDGIEIQFEGGEINNYLIAGADITDPIIRSGLMEKASLGSLTVSDAEGMIFSMDGATTSMSDYAPGETMTFDFDVNGMVADMGKLPEPEARQTMAALGYEQLRGDVTSSGSWDTGSGRMVLDEMLYKVEDAADLNITFDIGGYTPELVGAMQDLQMQMVENPDAANMAMLGLAQQIEINAIAIELEDASLTNRILDFVGEQQGMSRQNVIAMAKGILPIGLAQLQNPAFAAEATAAVGAFLDNPTRLRIAAEPATAVPVAQLMAAAMTAPQSLIEALAVTVTADK